MPRLAVGDSALQLVRLFTFFFAAYPIRSTLMVAAMTVAALSEGIGIAALLPMIGLVIDGEGGGGAIAGYVAQLFALAGLEPTLGGLALFIVLALGLKSLLMMVALTQVGYAAAHVAMQLRLAAVQSLLDARWRHFVDQRAGDLASAGQHRAGARGQRLHSHLSYPGHRSSAPDLRGALHRHILGDFAPWRSPSVPSALSRWAGSSPGAARAGQSQTELQKSFMTRFLQGLDGMKPLKAMARERSLRPLMEAGHPRPEPGQPGDRGQLAGLAGGK